MLKSISRFGLLLAIFMMPLPLFYDLVFMNLMLEVGAFNAFGLLPMPLAIIILIPAYLVFLLMNFKYDYIKFIILRGRFIAISLGMIAFFLFFGTFFSGLGFLRLMQLIFFIFLILFIFKVDDKKLVDMGIYIILFSVSILITSHFLSILIGSDELMNVPRDEFVVMWGYDIYQSLTSYPAILFLYFCFFYYLALFYSKNKYINIIIYFDLIIIFYLIMTAARKISLIEFSVFFFILFILITRCFTKAILFNMSSKISVKSIEQIFFVSLFGMLISFIFLGSSLDTRLTEQIASGTSDGHRFEVWNAGLVYISSSYEIFLFGKIGNGAPGFHNFFLDSLARVGVVGLFLIFSLFLYLIFNITRFYQLKKLSITAKSLMAIIFFDLFLQSMINSALSQPYYLINFILIFNLIVLIDRFQINPTRYKKIYP